MPLLNHPLAAAESNAAAVATPVSSGATGKKRPSSGLLSRTTARTARRSYHMLSWRGPAIGVALLLVVATSEVLQMCKTYVQWIMTGF